MNIPSKATLGLLALMVLGVVANADFKPALARVDEVQKKTQDFAKDTWALGPFVKQKDPVLLPSSVSTFRCPIKNEEVKWEEWAAYNPAVVVKDGKVWLLYRGNDKPWKWEPDPGRKVHEGFTDRIGLAYSSDGRTFTRYSEPVLYPDNDFMKDLEWPGGLWDPRIVEDEDGTYYLYYNTNNGHDHSLCVATSKDLIHWTKRGPVSGLTISGSIIWRLGEDGRRMAARINGKYGMYYDHYARLATSDNLIDWQPVGKQLWGYRKGYYDSASGEPGTAMLTDAGIMFMYVGQNHSWGTEYGADPTIPAGAWTMGQALLDSSEPWRILERADRPFIQASYDWEKKGLVPNTTVAHDGLVYFKGQWLLYYGGADRVIGLAVHRPLKESTQDSFSMRSDNSHYQGNREPSGEYYDWKKTKKPERPWMLPYHQTVITKLFLCSRKYPDKGVDKVYLTFEQALEVIRKLDNITLGVPKVAYLVGWQGNGHDSVYPSLDIVNEALKRPQDKMAVESLRWLMREAKKYNTAVSLHINLLYALETSPLWETYDKRNILAKDREGKLIRSNGKDRSGYISYTEEWKQGLLQKRLDGLLEMLPELVDSKTLHIDWFAAWRPDTKKGPISPFLGHSVQQEMATQRKIYRYLRDKGLDVTSEGSGWCRTDAHVGLQPMAWWDYPSGMPPELYCNSPMHAEEEVKADPENLSGLLDQFCLMAVPWLYQNNLNAVKGKQKMREPGGALNTHPRGKLFEEVIAQHGDNVFMPALWKDKTIVAYSRTGYTNKTWELPPDWKNVKMASISRIMLDGLKPAGEASVSDGKLTLSVNKREALVISPKSEATNDHYKGNRAPLEQSAYIPLPPGAVRPKGWLKRQMELQANGFTGHLEELSRFLVKNEKNAWTTADGSGELGGEEVPYWLRGYILLGYALQDKDVIEKAHWWIEKTLQSVRADGFFGPEQGRKGVRGVWPYLLNHAYMLHALMAYYEYTEDQRVIDLMKGYFRWQMTVPQEEFFSEGWQRNRVITNLTAVHWLYNRTGEEWLLELADKTFRSNPPFEGQRHNVDIAENFYTPTAWWIQSGNPEDRTAAERNYHAVWSSEYGQVPGGMFGADEQIRPGYFDPRQGSEACGMVEMIRSCENLLCILGETQWADRCEDVAFNSYPASVTADYRGMRYFTCPNLVVSNRGSKVPDFYNEGTELVMDPWGKEGAAYGPEGYRCCLHNTAQSWARFNGHLWLATPDNGLAAMLYAPCWVTAKVGDGTEVTIEEKTRYPFEETIELTLSMSGPETFPLKLRIPGWCKKAEVQVNGSPIDVSCEPDKVVTIDRAWSNGDRVLIEFPMPLSLRQWEKNGNSVSIDRGPLTYSLKIGENYVKCGGTDKWPQYEILPTTPWNYGLVLNGNSLTETTEIIKRPWPHDDQPFTADAAPVLLRTKAARIPIWKKNKRDIVDPVPRSPVHTDQPVETVDLIPMGAARLRISAFPRVE